MSQTATGDGKGETDSVWTYRGYRMSPGEFNTAMVHLYRGEINRSNVWRTRLDSTTNWAVVATAAALSFVFGGPNHPHFMIIVNTLLVALFLFIEARRYRYYELWTCRVRLMETDFFAAMLVSPFRPDEDWANNLANSLLHPQFPITMWEALGRRLRRNYLFLFVVLGVSWLAKVAMHPQPVSSLEEFMRQAAVGPVPGFVVLLFGIVFNGALLALGWLTASLQEATGEVLPRYPVPLTPSRLVEGISEVAHGVLPGALPRFPHRQHLAYIITDKGDTLARQVMHDLHRGVTSLIGRGMYTGQEHLVLLCAVAPTEVARLKSIVRETDPQAFVIIGAAQEVMGKGFKPLAE